MFASILAGLQKHVIKFITSWASMFNEATFADTSTVVAADELFECVWPFCGVGA